MFRRPRWSDSHPKTKECVELASIPNDAFGGRGAEQCDQDQAPILAAAEEALRCRVLRSFALLLEAGEEWRLLQLETDIAGNHDQDSGKQERDTPAPVGERGVAQGQPADEDDRQRGDDAYRRRRLDPARVQAALAVGSMFRDVGGRAAIFAAEGQALDRADNQQQDRCGKSPGSISRQQTHKEGGEAHQA